MHSTSSIDKDGLSSIPLYDILSIKKKKRIFFFICQPLIIAFVIFPFLILFWQSGWNFWAEWLNTSLGQQLTLLLPLYFLSQLFLFFIYIFQDYFYHFLRRQKSKFFSYIILQLHSLFTGVSYTMQWVTIWTIWDRYTSMDIQFMMLISIIAILSIIVITGHLSDLVCSPFVISYDSIKYNIRIGIGFITEKMNQILVHILNYFFYEYLMGILIILAWRGIYGFFDAYLYPNDENLSAGLSLLIGYLLYFILMYTQSLQNTICFMPKFIQINYPLLTEHLRHLSAFLSCVLLWRGYWILFDLHIATLSLAKASPYRFYVVGMMIAFLILSILRTASSINGPMSNIDDQCDLFPLYSNCLLIKWFDEKKLSSEVSSTRSDETSIYKLFTVTVF